jgi:hypothetical protein
VSFKQKNAKIQYSRKGSDRSTALNLNKSTKLSETLLVTDYIKFEQDVEHNAPDSPFLYNPSPPTVLVTRTAVCRETVPRSQATSTPVLSSKSSYKELHSDAATNLGMVTPVKYEDEVFTGKSDLGQNIESVIIPACASSKSSLHDDSCLEATPQRPFVNRSRGNPKFGGPAASLMAYIGHQGTFAIPDMNDAQEKRGVHSIGTEPNTPKLFTSPDIPRTNGSNAHDSNRQDTLSLSDSESLPDDPAVPGRSVMQASSLVNVRCICGNDQDTETQQGFPLRTIVTNGHFQLSLPVKSNLVFGAPPTFPFGN